MNKAPTWTLPVDRETLHVLAWFSSLDLLAAFKLAQQKQSWRHPHYVLEQIVRVRLDEALVYVQGPCSGLFWSSWYAIASRASIFRTLQRQSHSKSM
jgi:hypothetical protein